MSEDPTRATPRPTDLDVPTHGRVGPLDPHSDPATDPAMRPVPGSDDGPTMPVATDPPTAPVPTAPITKDRPPVVVTRTRTGGLWTGLILSAIVLIFLLIFILQNSASMVINFLWFTGSLPSGVALLLAAVAGLLLVAIPGALRILQLRRAAKRAARDR